MNHTKALAKQETPSALDFARTAHLVDVTITEAAAEHVVAWTDSQRVAALHESAHCIVSAVLGLPIASVSIRGSHGGRVESDLDADTQATYRRDSTLRASIVALLAGLMAERHFLGISEATDGNAADLTAATNLALSRLSNGLDPSFPLIAIDAFGYGDKPDRLVSRQVDAVIGELERAEKEADRLVALHADAIIAFAARLFDRRRLDTDALDAALREVEIEPAPRGA